MSRYRFSGIKRRHIPSGGHGYRVFVYRRDAGDLIGDSLQLGWVRHRFGVTKRGAIVDRWLAIDLAGRSVGEPQRTRDLAAALLDTEKGPER